MRQSDSRPRVVIAGLGDIGLLTAIRLARHADVVGISVKPGLISGQELGVRLSRPEDWVRDYWIAFDRFRALDRVRTIQARLTGLDLDARKVFAQKADGSFLCEEYDALVISTGITNGFWRRPELQSAADVDTELRTAHDRVAAAGSVIVVGGGAAAVSAAANIARTWPGKRVDMYFPADRALPGHHPRTWDRVRHRLTDAGVVLHPGHRALLPNGITPDEITSDPVQSTGCGCPGSCDGASIAECATICGAQVRFDVRESPKSVQVTPPQAGGTPNFGAGPVISTPGSRR